MENKWLLPISIIILAVSIVFGSIWIGHSIEQVARTQTQNSNTQVSREKALLTDMEAAEYLNISIDEFRNILFKDSQEKSVIDSYPTYKFIPYLEISNGSKMFSKKELDEWVKFNTFNK